MNAMNFECHCYIIAGICFVFSEIVLSSVYNSIITQKMSYSIISLEIVVPFNVQSECFANVEKPLLIKSSRKWPNHGSIKSRMLFFWNLNWYGMNSDTYLAKCCGPTMTVACYVNAFGKHVSVLIAFPLSVFLPYRQSLLTSPMWGRFADVVTQPKNHTKSTQSNT